MASLNLTVIKNVTKTHFLIVMKNYRHKQTLQRQWFCDACMATKQKTQGHVPRFKFKSRSRYSIKDPPLAMWFDSCVNVEESALFRVTVIIKSHTMFIKFTKPSTLLNPFFYRLTVAVSRIASCTTEYKTGGYLRNEVNIVTADAI